MIKLAAQLYTVRDDSAVDFEQTMRKVAAIGYKGFEFAGFYGMTKEKLKDLMTELGVAPAGVHVGLGELEESFDAFVEYQKYIGTKNVVIPWMDVDEMPSLFDRLNVVCKKLVGEGFTVLFHNHNREFEIKDGKYILDILVENVPLFNLELDTCWSEVGGANTVEYIKSHADRVKLLHIKDYTRKDGKPDGQVILQSVGKGVVDVKSIIKAGVEVGAEWFIVENDLPQPDGITSLTESYDYLSRI